LAAAISGRRLLDTLQCECQTTKPQWPQGGEKTPCCSTSSSWAAAVSVSSKKIISPTMHGAWTWCNGTDGIRWHADRARGAGRGGRQRPRRAAVLLRPARCAAPRAGAATGDGPTLGTRPLAVAAFEAAAGRGGRRRRGRRRPHPPPWLAAATSSRRSPGGGGDAIDRAARGPAAGGQWGGMASSPLGRLPVRTRDGSGASAGGGGASAGEGAWATARATGGLGRAPPPQRLPAGGWPLASDGAAGGAAADAAADAAARCVSPSCVLGGHGRATGWGAVGHAHRASSNVHVSRVARVVWWREAGRPLALGR